MTKLEEVTNRNREELAEINAKVQEAVSVIIGLSSTKLEASEYLTLVGIVLLTGGMSMLKHHVGFEELVKMNEEMLDITEVSGNGQIN